MTRLLAFPPQRRLAGAASAFSTLALAWLASASAHAGAQPAAGAVSSAASAAAAGPISADAPASAPTPSVAPPGPGRLRFPEYLDAVERHNPALAAQQQTIRSAEAEISIAGVRPDPSVTYGVSNIEMSRAVSPKPPRTQEVGLDLPIELGGKRARRIQAARSNLRLTEAGVEGFRNGLYSEAAAAFVEACRSRAALARQESSLAALAEIARANAVRQRAGDVGGLELAQSRVERDRFAAEVKSARAAASSAQIRLAIPLGKPTAEAFGDMALDCEHLPPVPPALDALLAQALERRDTVRIARAALENAYDNLALARANRWVDPSVHVGLDLTPGVNGTLGDDSQPLGDGVARSRMLSVSVSIPLPFSRLQRGELEQAEARITQAMLDLRGAELTAQTEVRSAHATYLAARDNAEQYRMSVLPDADRVLDGKRRAYRHGSASLLEVLDAQRSADDTYQAYLQARADLAAAAVQLQLSIGERPSL